MSNRSDPVARYAATQSVTEVGLGSLLHGLRVPLTGHFLSLNQGALLTWATRTAETRREAVRRASSISTVAALVKSFSPAGKRLFPMVAIATQGWLFSLGLALGGVNVLGAALGMALLSVWPFAQPLLVAYVLFGAPWFEAWARLWEKVAGALALDRSWGPSVLLAVCASYALLAATLGAAAWMSGRAFEDKYLARFKNKHPRIPSFKVQNPIAGAFRDLLHPWFLASTALGLAAFWLSGQATEPVLALYLARVLLLGWLFFWLLRAFQGTWLQPLLQRFPALNQTLDEVRRREP